MMKNRNAIVLGMLILAVLFGVVGCDMNSSEASMTFENTQYGDFTRSFQIKDSKSFTVTFVKMGPDFQAAMAALAELAVQMGEEPPEPMQVKEGDKVTGKITATQRWNENMVGVATNLKLNGKEMGLPEVQISLTYAKDANGKHSVATVYFPGLESNDPQVKELAEDAAFMMGGIFNRK